MPIQISRINSYNSVQNNQNKTKFQKQINYSPKTNNIGFTGSKPSKLIGKNNSEVISFLMGVITSFLSLFQVANKKTELSSLNKENLSRMTSAEILTLADKKLNRKSEKGLSFPKLQEDLIKLVRASEEYLNNNKIITSDISLTRNSIVKILAENSFNIKPKEIEFQKKCMEEYSKMVDSYLLNKTDKKSQDMSLISEEIKKRQKILDDVLKNFNKTN